MSAPIPQTDYPTAGRQITADQEPSINDLFNMGKPTQVQRPSGVDLYTLVSNAAQFTKFLKPFIVIEKQLAKANSKYQAADRARDDLYTKRAQLLDKSLSE